MGSICLESSLGSRNPKWHALLTVSLSLLEIETYSLYIAHHLIPGKEVLSDAGNVQVAVEGNMPSLSLSLSLGSLLERSLTIMLTSLRRSQFVHVSHESCETWGRADSLWTSHWCFFNCVPLCQLLGSLRQCIAAVTIHILRQYPHWCCSTIRKYGSFQL